MTFLMDDELEVVAELLFAEVAGVLLLLGLVLGELLEGWWHFDLLFIKSLGRFPHCRDDVRLGVFFIGIVLSVVILLVAGIVLQVLDEDILGLQLLCFHLLGHW